MAILGLGDFSLNKSSVYVLTGFVACLSWTILYSLGQPQASGNTEICQSQRIRDGEIFIGNKDLTLTKNVTTAKIQNSAPEQCYFEHVFSFPLVKYIALINRLKVYHIYGTGIVVPSSGVMELLNIVSENTFFISSYIGLTGAAVLALGTLPFRNIIGHLYISDDNEKIKISSVGYSGKRIDRIVNVNDWIPLLEMRPRKTDLLYLSPQLKDGTKYKLFIKFGNVKNPTRMGQVLE